MSSSFARGPSGAMELPSPATGAGTRANHPYSRPLTQHPG